MKLEIRPADLAEVAGLLAQTDTPKANTTGGTVTAAELCEGGNVFAIEHDGRIVGAYGLRCVDHAFARVVWVQAAAGHLPGADLTETIMPAIEAQARVAMADQVAITTRRRGLVEKLAAQGYRVTGVTMRKDL